MTAALGALEVALGDVDNLIEHHPKTAAPARGRPTTDEGPLLRSCVLLTYAAWEVYVEDSLLGVVEGLTREAAPQQLPEALRDFVADRVGSDPWKLAGEAWRDATLEAVTVRVRGSEEDDSFGVNTAGPRQIVALHEQVLGARPLNTCRWQKMPTRRVKEELAAFVRLRGAIAHTGQAPTPLHLQKVRDWRAFVQRLARQLDQHLEEWAAQQLPPSAASE